jgi:hypothetical protein
MRLSLLLSAAALLLGRALPAQTVDEGTFTLFRGQAQVGRESFAIRKSGGGSTPIYTSTATSITGSRRVTPALRTDSVGSPIAYQVEIREGSKVEEKMSATLSRGRFSTRVTTPQGEATREFIVGENAVLLDDDLVHQYYFIAMRTPGRALLVVVPRRGQQLASTLSDGGSEKLTIGDGEVVARHLVLSIPGASQHHLWVDRQGRLLKVRVDDRGMSAIRDELPQ